MSITPFNTTLDIKMEWLRAKLTTLLDAHGYATFNVHKFVTKAMLGMESTFDYKAVFGNPVAWCRIAPIDMERDTELTDEEEDIHGSTVLVGHTFSVLIQYEFIESNVYDGSSFDQWNKLLFSRTPAGVLFELSTLGAEVVQDDVIVQVEPPETIAIPEFPVAVYGAPEETFVHHCDFRVTLI